MGFRHDTKHLPKQTQEIIRQRDEADRLRKLESEKKRKEQEEKERMESDIVENFPLSSEGKTREE